MLWRRKLKVWSVLWIAVILLRMSCHHGYSFIIFPPPPPYLLLSGKWTEMQNMITVRGALCHKLSRPCFENVWNTDGCSSKINKNTAFPNPVPKICIVQIVSVYRSSFVTWIRMLLFDSIYAHVACFSGSFLISTRYSNKWDFVHVQKWASRPQ